MPSSLSSALSSNSSKIDVKEESGAEVSQVSNNHPTKLLFETLKVSSFQAAECDQRQTGETLGEMKTTPDRLFIADFSVISYHNKIIKILKLCFFYQI